MPAKSVVVWRNSHVLKVPRQELWGTTVFMDPALGGAELEQRLAVLLRMLVSAAVPPGSRPGGNDQAAGHAPATSTSSGRTPDGSTPDGSAAGDSAPSGAAPGGALLSG